MKAWLRQTASYLSELGDRVSSRETRRWSIFAEMLVIVMAALLVLLLAKLVKGFEFVKRIVYAAR